MEVDEDLLRVKKTVLQMARDRGYSLSKEEKKLIKLDDKEFIKEYPSKILSSRISYDMTQIFGEDFIYGDIAEYISDKIDKNIGILSELFTNPKGTRSLLVVFISKISTANIKELFDLKEGMGLSGINIITTNIEKISRKANSEIIKLRCILFSHKELITNPKVNKYAPKIIIPKNSEFIEYLRDTHLKKNQLPKRQANDLLIRYYGLVRGNVFIEFYKQLGIIGSLIDSDLIWYLVV